MKSSRFYGNCRNKTPTSLSRILDLAEENALPYRNEDDQFSVTVLPPTNATGYITDEDSGDEDGAGTINNLPGSMLLAPALMIAVVKMSKISMSQRGHQTNERSKLTSQNETGSKQI